NTAGLEDLVPLETEVAAVERRRRREGNPLVPPRVLGLTAVLGVEDHLAGDVPDRERAVDAVAVTAGLLHLGALEPKLGEALHVQEVRRPQVIVAVGYAGIDAAAVDRHLDAAARQVLGVEIHLAAPGAK